MKIIGITVNCNDCYTIERRKIYDKIVNAEVKAEAAGSRLKYI